MSRRSDQRRDAVFALYQRDVTGRPLDELLEDAKPFTRELASGTEERVVVMELCQKAVAEEAGSVRLWSLYGEFMWRLYRAAKEKR